MATGLNRAIYCTSPNCETIRILAEKGADALQGEIAEQIANMQGAILLCRTWLHTACTRLTPISDFMGYEIASAPAPLPA